METSIKDAKQILSMALIFITIAFLCTVSTFIALHVPGTYQLHILISVILDGTVIAVFILGCVARNIFLKIIND